MTEIVLYILGIVVAQVCFSPDNLLRRHMPNWLRLLGIVLWPFWATGYLVFALCDALSGTARRIRWGAYNIRGWLKKRPTDDPR